jgi:Protein of unknown function (DUF3574)
MGLVVRATVNLAGHFAASSVVAVLGACATTPEPSCPQGQRAAVQELVYFGTDTPTGRVTPDEWTRFLRDTVTPKFPDGLTAWQASGQWRSASGAIVQEPSYVLSLVHPPGSTSEQAIAELIAAYKAQFRQEAVLRVTAHACISF